MDSHMYYILKKQAALARINCIKTQMEVGSGHLGGAFSAMEIMTYLFFKEMDFDVNNPLREERDIFILSKGHSSIGYYSLLAQRGFFPLEELKTFRKLNSRLQGHSHIDAAPGIEASTGSLGQGLSFGIGIALGYIKKGIKNKVYVMVGDGELNEGQNWEAIMLLGRLKLDNLLLIIDNNKIQLDGTVEEIIPLDSLTDKTSSFRLKPIEIDGHDYSQIDMALEKFNKGEINVIIANTIKGKGVSFMENSVSWHSQKCTNEEAEAAVYEIEKSVVI